MPPEAQPSAAATTAEPANATTTATQATPAAAAAGTPDSGAAAAKAGAKATTVLSPDPAGDPAAAAAATATTATTPPDWRAAFGTDEKLAKLLGRFTTPEAFGKAYLEAQGKISSGIKQPLKEGASPEEVAAFRTEHGIPDKPDGYFERLPQGLVIGEDDKAMFTEWGSKMHALNAPPALIAETVKWFYGMQEQQAQNAETMDRQHRVESQTALKAAWGPEYTENVHLVTDFLGDMSQDMQGMFKDATLPDGRRLFNSPEVLQWLAQKARIINPMAYIPGAGAGDEGKSLDDRIIAIEGKMGTKEYINNEKMQAELRALYTRREQLAQRGAA